MKKLIALLLLFAMMLSLSGCGEKAPEPEDSMGFAPSEATPAPTFTPVQPVGDPQETPEALPSTLEATPTPEPTPVSGIDSTAVETPSSKEPKNYKDAVKINTDVMGWIKVPNTNIDYPILYSKDFYYNTHDIFKKKSNNGCIYAYYNMLTKNNTITGHNMRKAGLMLNGLHKLQDKKEDLKTQKNRTFSIDWFTLTSWEVFALYETQDNEPKSTLEYNTHHLANKSAAEVQQWIDTQKGRSEIDLGVNVSPDDYFITLVTCGDNYDYDTAQSRLYFFLRCPDPIKKKS